MTMNWNAVRNGTMPGLAPVIGAGSIGAAPGLGMLDFSQLGPLGTNPAALGSMPAVNAAPMSWWDQLMATPLGTTTNANGIKTQGLFDMGLGAAQGLMGSYLGFQNLGIAKDTLAQNKRQFDLNFGAQQKTTNARMADRQAARVAANPTAYQSVSDYMKGNGI